MLLSNSVKMFIISLTYTDNIKIKPINTSQDANKNQRSALILSCNVQITILMLCQN